MSPDGTVTTSVNGAVVSTITAQDIQPDYSAWSSKGAPVVWRNLKMKAG